MRDVSIIIPAYNRTDLLRETLVSCFILTYANCEIIVVDDGSEEDIAGVVDLVSLEFDTASVRYIRQSHLGSNAARNRGVREARGEWIQFVDSDDVLHPNKIELQRQILLKRSDLAMV